MNRPWPKRPGSLTKETKMRDSIRGQAWYRREMVGVLINRLGMKCLERINQIMQKIAFKLNGHLQEVLVEPHWTLLELAQGPPGIDRHQGRLRGRRMRGLHGHSRWKGRECLSLSGFGNRRDRDPDHRRIVGL